MEKLNLTQQKQAFTNQITKARFSRLYTTSGLETEGLFSFRRLICDLLTWHLPTYLQAYSTSLTNRKGVITSFSPMLCPSRKLILPSTLS